MLLGGGLHSPSAFLVSYFSILFGTYVLLIFSLIWNLHYFLLNFISYLGLTLFFAYCSILFRTYIFLFLLIFLSYFLLIFLSYFELTLFFCFSTLLGTYIIFCLFFYPVWNLHYLLLIFLSYLKHYFLLIFQSCLELTIFLSPPRRYCFCRRLFVCLSVNNFT